MITPMKIVLILAALVVFFGAKKLPELGRGLGEGIRNFRRGLAEAETPETGSIHRAESKTADREKP